MCIVHTETNDKNVYYCNNFEPNKKFLKSSTKS